MAEDERAVLAAVGGWVGRGEEGSGNEGGRHQEVGWVVRGRSSWVGDLRTSTSNSIGDGRRGRAAFD
jgi:hypothetical protein